MNEKLLSYYSQHSIFTETDNYGELIKELPDDISSIVSIIQGLLINPLDEDIYNMKFTSHQRSEVHLRTFSQLIEYILKLNSGSLLSAREPSLRVAAVGRHFVLMFVSILREKGIPARFRVGFVNYLNKRKHEDRYIAEYWDKKRKRWILVDPVIDDLQREFYNIQFDTLDLKYGQHFYCSGHAWEMVHNNEAKANDFGYRTYFGKRFIRNNLARDFEVLNKVELLPWDFYGNLNRKIDSEIVSEEIKLLDQIAGLTREPDKHFEVIEELYYTSEHSLAINAKLRLLGVVLPLKRADVTQLRDYDSEWDELVEGKTEEAQSELVQGGNVKDLLIDNIFECNQTNDSDQILIRGARQHNLKNIDIDLPRLKMIVVTGVSGSGKSSFAFDTIYAEGQRRFVESFTEGSAQFSRAMQKPDVDQVIGLNPVIAIEQKNGSTNPRSTVGTLTDIYDYLRILFSRLGVFHCPQCGRMVKPYSVKLILDNLQNLKCGISYRILATVNCFKSQKYEERLKEFEEQGYLKVIIDGKEYKLKDKIPVFKKTKKYLVKLVVGEFVSVSKEESVWQEYIRRMTVAVKSALKIGNGSLTVSISDKKDLILSLKNSCTFCDIEFPELKTSFFNHNHPDGMCPECDGLGIKLNVDAKLIILNPEASLLDGACKIYGDMRKSLSKPNSVTAQIFVLAENMGVDLEQPWNELPDDFKHAVLYGTGEEIVSFTYEMAKGGRMSTINRPVEGLVPMVNRLYRNTKAKPMKETHLQYMSEQPCDVCEGEYLCAEARYIIVGESRFPEVAKMTIAQIIEWVQGLTKTLTRQKYEIAKDIIKTIWHRAQFLMNVGLHYLSLDRTAPTLSGGEIQRIRLATQLSCGLVGILYVLDEPSIGLHSRDHNLLIKAMKNLKDMGNTVLVVEHDFDTMLAADMIIEIGPGAGTLGGNLVAQGTPKEIMLNEKSITGKYISGEKKITSPHNNIRKSPVDWLTLIDASENNLKNVTVSFPLGVLTCVTGVSGSGKSSLVSKTLASALRRILHNSHDIPGAYREMKGLDSVDKVIIVNQTPIGRTPRSNPATYVEVFDHIREVFSSTKDAKAAGYTTNQFSFNKEGGRCESCEGLGTKKIELHFMPDAWLTCQDCNGERYNPDTLEIKYKDKTIADVLNMDINEALEFFSEESKIVKILTTLCDVGLEYIKLGQSALTLSGGEAQRLKLAKELCRPDTGKTVYILDEPTTGLHFVDIQKLLNVLHRFKENGNTIIIIEHNLDVIKTADWIIDVGPEGGSEGGQIIAQGTPEEVADIEASYTGRYLKPML